MERPCASGAKQTALRVSGRLDTGPEVPYTVTRVWQAAT